MISWEWKKVSVEHVLGMLFPKLVNMLQVKESMQEFEVHFYQINAIYYIKMYNMTLKFWKRETRMVQGLY